MPRKRKLKRVISKEKQSRPICYGDAMVGTKGQFVIPVQARKKFNIKPGDKVMVFGSSSEVLAVVKADKVSEIVAGLVG